MYQFEEVEYNCLGLDLSGLDIDDLVVANEGDTGDLAARIELYGQRLEFAVALFAIDEADCEWHQTMHARTIAFEE